MYQRLHKVQYLSWESWDSLVSVVMFLTPFHTLGTSRSSGSSTTVVPSGSRPSSSCSSRAQQLSSVQKGTCHSELLNLGPILCTSLKQMIC